MTSESSTIEYEAALQKLETNPPEIKEMNDKKDGPTSLWKV